MKLYNLNTVIDFGRFKGKTIKNLTEKKNSALIINGKSFIFPDTTTRYIDWCVINVDSFYMDNETVELMEQLKPSMKLSEEAKMALAHKRKIWERQNKQPNFQDDYKFKNKLKDMLGKNPDMFTQPKKNAIDN